MHISQPVKYLKRKKQRPEIPDKLSTNERVLRRKERKKKRKYLATSSFKKKRSQYEVTERCSIGVSTGYRKLYVMAGHGLRSEEGI